MKKFNYDVVQLIQCVRDRSCIWDKRIEVYKDRIERRVAWEEIFALLEPTYEDMTEEDKRLTGELIINKWTNVRDTFIKTLKPHFGKPKKKYLYYEQLKFLTEVHPVDEYNVSIEYSADSNFQSQDTSTHKTEQDSDSDLNERCKKIKKRKRYAERQSRKSKKTDSDDSQTYLDCAASENDNIDFVGLNEASTSSETRSRLMNEDEAFFASLLPTVVKYDDDEKLEFRIEVLNLMKKIKVKRQSSMFENH